MKKQRKIGKSKILEIVGDGAIASKNTADGRLIPVLILKNDNNNDLESLINIHIDTPPGDAESFWGKKRFNSRIMYLIIKFEKPLYVEISIEFNLLKHYALADGIMHSKGVYLQSGQEGDAVGNDINTPRVLVEIPFKMTIDYWDKTLKKSLVKSFMIKGFNKKEALVAAMEQIDRQRELWGRRIQR